MHGDRPYVKRGDDGDLTVAPYTRGKPIDVSAEDLMVVVTPYARR